MKLRLLLFAILMVGITAQAQEPQTTPPAVKQPESQQPAPTAPVKTKPPAQAQPEKAPETQRTRPIDLIWGLTIPMRDGVQLNGTVYKPAGQTEPLPVIFTLTPYISDSYHERAY